MEREDNGGSREEKGTIGKGLPHVGPPIKGKLIAECPVSFLGA